MKLFAVAFISFQDNILKIDTIAANTWQEAVTWSSLTKDQKFNEYSSLEDACIEAFERDAALAVTEICNEIPPNTIVINNGCSCNNGIRYSP